ncbi:MAG TPA: helix-turn-helix domain-containing protein [Candidatus Binatia bacterium]|nr:helix-turn-helix domain-containing protein [Candidatus Binatia bacterium]
MLSPDGVIRAENLPDRLLAPAPVAPPATEEPRSLDELERRHVEQALAEAATLEEAAARLGINVTTLWRKRRRWGIE